MFPRPSRFARKGKAGAKATTPAIENKAIETVEELKVSALPEVKHVGGPWFEVDGERYMGRAAAEEALKQILEDLF